MTYNVFGGTLNPTLLLLLDSQPSFVNLEAAQSLRKDKIT